jgi:hypothetical protein
MYRYEVEFSSRSNERGPVTCAACGCRLQSASGARDGEYYHFSPLGGRDARGCRVGCVDAAHDRSGRPVYATV